VGFIRQINGFFHPVIYPSTYLEKYGDILSFQPAYLGEIIKLLGQSYMDTSKHGISW
jgi:hypothetical protein